MIGYNPSHLNKNETLLEAFHRVEAYLKANPQYQVYQSSAQYQEGTQEYALSTVIVPEGSKVSAGDVVLFNNVYYAVITSVSETTFSVATATNFRGTDGTNGKDGVTPNIAVSATVDNSEGTPSVEVTKRGTNENPSFAFNFHNIKGATGATGAPGPTGATGATPNITMTAGVVGTTGEPYVDVFKGDTPPEQPTYTFVFHNLKGEPGTPGPAGENGKNGSNGKNGNATYLCSAQITQNTAGISKNAITTFPGRPIIENDIIISTAITTFGAMSQVIGQDENTVTVNFIGTLKSEVGGGTTLNNYTTILDATSNPLTTAQLTTLTNILTSAKGNVSISMKGKVGGQTGLDLAVNYSIGDKLSDTYYVIYFVATGRMSNSKKNYTWYFWVQDNELRTTTGKCIAISDTGEITLNDTITITKVRITYWNDTELT